MPDVVECYGDPRYHHIKVRPLGSFWCAWYYIDSITMLRWTGTGDTAIEAVKSLWERMHRWD